MELFPLDSVEMSLFELKALLESTDREGFEVVVMTDRGLPMGPFRYCFQFPGDQHLYCVVQKDLALQFDVMQFLNWLQRVIVEDFSWLCHQKVKWGDVFSCLQRKISDYTHGEVDEFANNVTVYYVPADPSHGSWSFFTAFWSKYFARYPIDLGWN